MNSIARNHLDPGTGSALDAGLNRLSTYLDEEADALSQILSLAARQDALQRVESLSALHLDPDSRSKDVKILLRDARKHLAALLGVVREIPMDIDPSHRLPADFEAGVRWTGARLEDIVATLEHSIA